MPSMVREASAILVAMTHLRAPGEEGGREGGKERRVRGEDVSAFWGKGGKEGREGGKEGGREGT